MIDFRSDTVTKPTTKMRKAMMEAVVGDDVYGDDPTINELEDIASKILGKEAALFVPSGTMGNQLSIFTHTSRGDEIIVGAHSHIKTYEVGATAVLSQVSFHTIVEENGMMDVKTIEESIRGEDIHYPNTSLICLENAHGSGVVLPTEYMEKVYNIAKKHDIKVHLDGARVFNAATALGVDVKEIAKYVDSVTFCLSKGLAAPIGSIICGDKTFIEKARKGRKLFGAGMRQVGVLGAPAIIALKEMTKRLYLDHENAAYLSDKLDQISEFEVDYSRRDINMVFVKSTVDFVKLSTFLKTYDVIIGGYKGEYLRIALHNDISKSDVDFLVNKIKLFIKEENNG